MSGSPPSWIESPRKMMAAGALLVVLVAAVPAFIATERSRPGEPAMDTAGAPQPTAEPMPAADPLAPPPDDWLAQEGEPAQARVSEDPDGALDCLVQPSRIVEIGSQTIGLIEKIHVERGERVEADQVVVELEAGVEAEAVRVARMRASLEGSLRAHEESVALSKKRKQRGAKLFRRNAVSADAHDELESQARLAQHELLQAQEARRLAALELRQAKAVLARRTLHSPISGVVVERLLEEGEVVDEETVLRIARIDPLRVDVLLPASRYGTVKEGMRATISPEFPVDASVVATVAIVDPIIDAASGTFSVRLDLPNEDGRIPGGLHCTVKFLGE